VRSAPTCALALLLSAVAAAPAGAAPAKTVTLSGTAYEFNNTGVRLAGATIRVAERPRLRATVAADGSYRLRVPARGRVTPYIVADGYHTIYLQTFTMAGRSLRRVNFQTPTDAVYDALGTLLDVPRDADGTLRQCAIVSTFSTAAVRDLSFDAFTAYGAHGVAGATATTRPALPKPIYFNDQVVPDPAQPSSSIDGGVIWTRVPTGVYRVSAQHPDRRFASFVATCRPGRVVNANPPWGLYEVSAS
jgi:hypothetical protein